jgi:ABC-2 type transport system ATP-binding protein
MKNILSIKNLNKVYKGGFVALHDINLDIKEGEIFALLGPNGAGKTTLINTICGIVNPTSGSITIDDSDHIKDFRHVRSLIGLVPQELTTDAFEKVVDTVSFSRRLFGLPPNRDYIEKLLEDLSLADKKNNKIMTLSGGMKRRVLIAKALSHEPRILFLDEPTAGVDVELRKSMWALVHKLRKSGVTIILTTHYIQEAEQMADRIGVINQGKIILVEDKASLMKKLGKKELIFDLKEKIERLPDTLSSFNLSLRDSQLVYTFDTHKEDNKITELLHALSQQNIQFKDLHTVQSSLEDIFVKLVKKL